MPNFVEASFFKKKNSNMFLGSGAVNFISYVAYLSTYVDTC